MAGMEGQAVRTILWLLRTGNCWPEAPHWTMGKGAHSGPQLWGQVENPMDTSGNGESRPSPRAEGPFPYLYQGPPLLYTTGGASGPKALSERETQRSPTWEEGAEKEALACPQLRQPGMRYRVGQQHPCAMGLEYRARMVFSFASDQDQPHGNGVCLEP